jgi:hypothetical protein
MTTKIQNAFWVHINRKNGVRCYIVVEIKDVTDIDIDFINFDMKNICKMLAHFVHCRDAIYYMGPRVFGIVFLLKNDKHVIKMIEMQRAYELTIIKIFVEYNLETHSSERIEEGFVGLNANNGIAPPKKIEHESYKVIDGYGGC